MKKRHQKMEIKLDGKTVTPEQLDEAQKAAASNPKIRIKETAPGEYKTLQRLEG